MNTIYRLIGARQARYGIDVGASKNWYQTIRECGFGVLALSIEEARGGPAEQVGEIADDASYAERFDALAKLEGLNTTWAAEEARMAAEAAADEEF